jgi:hypothetical protein
LWPCPPVCQFFGLLAQNTIDSWFIAERNLFPTVLEAVESKTKVPVDVASGESYFRLTASFPLCPHIAEGARDLLESLLLGL